MDRKLILGFILCLLCLGAVDPAAGQDALTAKLQGYLRTLNIRGSVFGADLNTDADPLFFHFEDQARDKADENHFLNPGFFMFRPAHEGGQVRFEIVFGRDEQKSFYGGDFHVFFGGARRVKLTLPPEKVRYGKRLFDNDAKARYRLVGSAKKLSLPVAQLTESLRIVAKLPPGGVFFLRKITFLKASAIAISSGAAAIDLAMDEGTTPRTRRGRRPSKTALRGPSGSSTLQKTVKRYEAALRRFEAHLRRATKKKSGHPLFLEALRKDLDDLEAIKGELEKLTVKKKRYGW